MTRTRSIGEAEGGTARNIAVMIGGPVLGLLYVIFLPFIGVAVLVQTLATKVLSEAGINLARGASFGWRPIEAYLSGRKAKKSGKE